MVLGPLVCSVVISDCFLGPRVLLSTVSVKPEYLEFTEEEWGAGTGKDFREEVYIIKGRLEEGGAGLERSRLKIDYIFYYFLYIKI